MYGMLKNFIGSYILFNMVAFVIFLIIDFMCQTRIFDIHTFLKTKFKNINIYTG